MGDLEGRRLAVVLRDLRVGGAERQALLIAEHLRHRHGAAVELWCFADDGPHRQRVLDSGLPLVTLDPGGGGSALARIRQITRFVRSARRRRPEVLLPFTDHPNKVCGALARPMGARASIWNQRDEGREVTGRPLERLALRSTRLFLCNSGAGREFLESRLAVDPAKIVGVRNGVRLESPRSGRDEWRQRLGLDDHRSSVLMIGNLSPYKDHPTLLRAWKQVITPSDHPTPLLLLAGRRDATAQLIESMIADLELADSARLLGEVDDIAGLLGAVDLVVHSSHREGCPNAVLEAMAAGRAVIATDIIGTREALGDSAETLVPARDPAALAAMISALLRSPAQRADLGGTNRRRIATVYDPDRCFDLYAGIVATVLAGSTAFPSSED